MDGRELYLALNAQLDFAARGMRPVDNNDESSSGGSFGDESSCASGLTSRRKVRSAARERRVEV